MNLQENIRRILREEKDRTKLIKKIIDFSNIFEYEHFCGVDIINPEERTDQYNFLDKNNVPFLIKVYFIGGPNSKVWPRTQGIRNNELHLIDDLRSHIKSFVPFNIEIMGSHVNTCDGYDKLMKRKYSTDELQESIRRIKEMMNLNEKLEDIQGVLLYHKTSTNRGLDIINSDSLRGVLPSGDYLGLDTKLANTKTQTAISFTRDKNWQPNNTIGIGLDSSLEDTGITFVVDKDKLKTKYKVEPFNYHGIDPDSEYKEKFNEFEERVMTNEIYPLHKYVIDIIYTGDNPEVQEIIDSYLNR